MPADRRACCSESSGRRCAEGRSSSKATLACCMPRSSKRRPRICSPTGSPAGITPQVRLAAGLPDQLKGQQNSDHISQSQSCCGQCAGCRRLAGKDAGWPDAAVRAQALSPISASSKNASRCFKAMSVSAIMLLSAGMFCIWKTLLLRGCNC